MLTGIELKIKRIRNDYKAMYIAEKLNVSKSYISMLERGKQDIPLHIYEKWILILK